ncbi:MAG: hypothetical protein NWF11_07335 [Candidatus Bathyarchaeota archaeon]|nr:hypothetical protein [Candidatus Bathyarchaeota archaeon]
MTKANTSTSTNCYKRLRLVAGVTIVTLMVALSSGFSLSTHVSTVAYGISSITIISPENVTYNFPDITSNLTLSFYIEVPRIRMVNWIGYSLDGQPMVTIFGNTSIPVAYGHHNISVSANGTFGGDYVSSETVDFTVSIESDLNGDGVINIADILLASAAYGSTPNDPNWNPRADVSSPKGIIDIFDLIKLASQYDETW